jgi:hypothetical protein
MSGAAGLAASIGARAIAGKAVANAKRAWTAIPPKVKLALAGVVLVVLLALVHQHYAHKALKAADEAGYARGVKVYERALHIVHQRAARRRQAQETVAADISKQVRNRYDEQARSIAAGADALRVRGPGAARCGPLDHSGLPAGAGGHASPAGPGDDAVPQVPDRDRAELIAMPFAGAVGFAEQHDLNRAEDLAWREWYDRQFKAWEQFRSGKPH